jgi:trk system potassium uptake protein TrkH
MDGASVPMKIVGRILSFFFLYMLVFVLFVFIIALSGVTVMQAMGIAVGCLSSVGSAAALYGFSDYAQLPAWTKLACCLLMVLGRLEIFSFLILLHTGIHPMRHKW